MERLSMRTFCSEAQHMHCNLHDGDHELASSYRSRARKIVSSSLALKQRKSHERSSSKEEMDDRYDKQKREKHRAQGMGKAAEGSEDFTFMLVHWRLWFWEKGQIGQEALHCAF